MQKHSALRYHDLPAAYRHMLIEKENAVLLETSRYDDQNYRSYIFLEPLAVMEAFSPMEFLQVLSSIEEYVAKGYLAAGFIGYECGFAFESVAPLVKSSQSIARFGVYDRVYVFNHRLGEFEGSIPEYGDHILPVSIEEESYSISDIQLATSEDNYRTAFDRIRQLIREGETYQVNFTSKYRFSFDGSSIALYCDLLRGQRVSYGGILRMGKDTLVCLSPELFFRRTGRHIMVKPMKGTVARGRTCDEDDAKRTWLAADEKNRAENVMIVDLMRNDLGRIAESGTVHVTDLWRVERYETLFQMTSTVEARLKEDVSYVELLKSLFPSGSVTGTPKVRAMQIIRELESESRGVYTGAIGFIGPKQQAVFNIAIRTIRISGSQGEMGVGSGIVYESSAEQELDECRLKGKFLTNRIRDFNLIESLLWEQSYSFLERHLERLRSSAEYFGFDYDVETVRQALYEGQRGFRPGTRYKVRLTLYRDGRVSIQQTPVEQHPTGLIPRVVVSTVSTDSRDVFLYHKTTHREVYECEYRKALALGAVDALFVNERSEVTEGSRHNLVIRRGTCLITPPVECGLLNGIYRQYLLESESHIGEDLLTLQSLREADDIFICNAVRGLRRVVL